MFRLYPLMLAAAPVLLGGCTRATFGFRPTTTSQVPDSTVVRVRGHDGQPVIEGRSLDWQAGQLKIVRAAGDTVAVPSAGTLEVRLAKKRSLATIGGLIGVGVGFGIVYGKCRPGFQCRPEWTPAIAGGVGALIGSRFSMANWVAVKRGTR